MVIMTFQAGHVPGGIWHTRRAGHAPEDSGRAGGGTEVLTICPGHAICLIKEKKVMENTAMSTVSQVLEKLRQKGMDTEFRWTPDGFTPGQGKYYQPDHLEIIKTFRFEGASNPSDMEIIYVIRTRDGVTGYSQDAYGAYSSHDGEAGYDNFIRLIPEKGHDQQLLFEL